MTLFRRQGLALAFSLGLALLLAGCAWTKKLTGGLPSGGLKKRVAVLPFQNNTPHGEAETGREAADLLSQNLAASGYVIVVPRDRVQAYLASHNLPTPLTQNTAVLVGRALGLNAVVLGEISEVSQVRKRTGWLRWFTFLSKKKEFTTAVLVSRVVDVESGTILLAETGAGETEVASLEAEQLWGAAQAARQSGPPEEVVEQSLKLAVASLSQSMVRGLAEFPWKGFILESSGATAVLAGGADVGIKPGDRFVVYAAGERVTNAAGQTYVIPGPVQAELEAVEVGAQTARLKVLEGQVNPGQAAHFVK